MRTIRRAFTVVELLVVIGIITVLLAVVMPVFNRVIERSRALTCTSNLRQVGQLFSIYAGQSNGHLPPYWEPSVSDQNYTAFYALIHAKILSAKGSLQAPPDPTFVVYAPLVLRCPSTGSEPPTPDNSTSSQFRQGKFRNGVTGNVLTADRGDWRMYMAFTPESLYGKPWGVWSSYSANGRHPASGGDALNYPMKSAGHQPKFTCIRNSADTWLAADGTSGDLGLSNTVFRHVGFSANFLYADGHVEGLKTTEVDGNYYGPLFQIIVNDSRLWTNGLAWSPP